MNIIDILAWLELGLLSALLLTLVYMTFVKGKRDGGRIAWFCFLVVMMAIIGAVISFMYITIPPDHEFGGFFLALSLVQYSSR